MKSQGKGTVLQLKYLTSSSPSPASQEAQPESGKIPDNTAYKYPKKMEKHFLEDNIQIGFQEYSLLSLFQKSDLYSLT